MIDRFLGHPLRFSLFVAKGLFFAHFLVDFVVTMSPTYGPSMLPTIEATGDWIVTSRMHRRGRGITVGDVVSVVHPMEPHEGAIKRVIGMPGDFVERNSPGTGSMIQVPQGHCWVVGDNIPHSRDSRIYGPIPLALVKGKVIAKLFPFRERKWIENGLQSPQ